MLVGFLHVTIKCVGGKLIKGKGLYLNTLYTKQ